MLPTRAPDTKPKRIVHGEDPEADYRRRVRERLTEICEEIEIPVLYRPGIVNSQDFSLALLCLALYGKIKKLEASSARIKRDAKKRVKAPNRKRKASA